MENARSYLEGGPRYTVISPHIGGAPDVGNSLLAIDRLVYREKRVTLNELRAILRANWEGHEPLRQYVLNRYTYYGNDDDAADAYTARLLDDFAAMVLGHNGESPILFPPGVSTFGRQIEWAPGRAATPFGARKGDVLAPNASPTPGTETKAHCPGLCSKSFFPSRPTTRKVFTSGVSVRISVMTPIIGIRVSGFVFPPQLHSHITPHLPFS